MLVSKEILNFNLKFPLTEPRPAASAALTIHNAHPPPSASSASLAPSHFRKQKYTLLTSRAEMTQQTSCIKVLPTKYLKFNQSCRSKIKHPQLITASLLRLRKSPRTALVSTQSVLLIPIAIKFPMAISVRGWRAGNGGESGKVGRLVIVIMTRESETSERARAPAESRAVSQL